MVQWGIGLVGENHLLTAQRPFPDDTDLHVLVGEGQRPLEIQSLEFFRKGVIVFSPQEGVIA